ncbi:18144_t:CDS:2, partial [Racocetra fulgida]
PTKLPIKLPDGKIRHQESNNDSSNENGEKKENSSSDSDNLDENLQDDMKANEADEDVAEFISIQNISSSNDITQKKEELATIAQMVSEEVRKLRHFEQSLISNYQAYLRSLETELKASLDAVKLITKMIKTKSYVVHEEVLNTFLHLRLKEELSVKALNNKDSVNIKTKGKKRKFDKQGSKKHLSKKLRKLYKERKEVEKEMKEAEAVVNREEREKTVGYFHQ